MKVILLKDIRNIGKEGDAKEVANGYAHNFLFPRKLAEAATERAIKKITALKEKIATEVQIDLEKTQKLAEELEGREIIILAKEKNGRLFGAINAKNISKEIKKSNFEIDEKAIILEKPIREIGDYEAKIELGHGIEASICVVVESAN